MTGGYERLEATWVPIETGHEGAHDTPLERSLGGAGSAQGQGHVGGGEEPVREQGPKSGDAFQAPAQLLGTKSQSADAFSKYQYLRAFSKYQFKGPFEVPIFKGPFDV